MLLVEQDGPVRRITLDRPDVRNAFNDEMILRLAEAMNEAAQDDSVRAVVIAGNGKVFCAGADINWMLKAAQYGPEENRADALAMSGLFHAITDCPKPVIARVHRAALGGAMGLICACDIVVAEEGTVFGFSEIRLGILPAVISPHVIGRIGPVHARHWFFTGGRFGTDEALRIGAIDRIAAPGEIDAEIESLLADICAGGPRASSEVKDLVKMVATSRVHDVQEDVVSVIARLRAGAEAQEGFTAFFERRKPNWILEAD